MLNENIKKLKLKIQFKQTKPVSCDLNVKLYLEALHKCVVVTIDKTASHFAFINKKYFNHK